MQPIPATLETADRLIRADPDLDLLEYLDDLAERVTAIVPECVGLTVAWLRTGLSFTLVATGEEVGALDAVQYVDGGPCVRGAEVDRVVASTTRADPLDESRWQLFSRVAAAQGVASTLTIPLESDGVVMGTVNMYAATADAFDGHHETLVAAVGTGATEAVRNADLSFSTREISQRAPAVLRARVEVATATRLLAEALGLDEEEAEDRLLEAADRAGVTVEALARMLLSPGGL